jgi:hypothetical protein
MNSEGWRDWNEEFKAGGQGGRWLLHITSGRAQRFYFLIRPLLDERLVRCGGQVPLAQHSLHGIA